MANNTLVEKAATIKRLDYSPLGSELKRQQALQKIMLRIR